MPVDPTPASVERRVQTRALLDPHRVSDQSEQLLRLLDQDEAEWRVRRPAMAKPGPRDRRERAGERSRQRSGPRWSTAAIDGTARGRVRGRERAGDRRPRRLQPGAGVLPLRLGQRPAAGRARRGERAADGRLPRLARGRQLRDGAGGVRPRDLRRGPRRRLRPRADRDDDRRAGGARPRRAGRRAAAALARPRRGRSRGARSAGPPPPGCCRRPRPAHALVAGFLGLELLASLDGDRAAAIAVFDRFRSLARVLDVLGGLRLPAGGREDR